ncbi:MAG: T9SS type A sorting domain-containing protein [Bacteroidia bacterium]
MNYPLRFDVITSPASCPTCCDGSGLGTVISSCSLPVTYLWNPGMVTLPTINNMCGNITYSLCVTDVCGCTLCDTLILCGFPAGISNLTPDQPVFMATYASAGQCIMASLLDGPSTAQLDLFDLQGRKILQSTLEKSETRSINAAALASGTYLIVVSDEKRLLGNQLLVIP